LKKQTFFMFFALILFLAISYKTSREYQKINEIRALVLRKESQTIASFIIAFRRTYQDIFLDEDIEMNKKTIHFLPARALNEINKRFQLDTDAKVLIRTVSDHPTHLKNMANDLEEEMIGYFRKFPDKKDKFIQKGEGYIYARPLIIEQKCLRCHNTIERTFSKKSMKQDTDYKVTLGDVRGVICIKTKERGVLSLLYNAFLKTLFGNILLYILLLTVIYYLIRTLYKKDKHYTKQLENDIREKTYEIEAQKEVLYYQAYHDPLTDIYNRMHFQDRLQYSIALSQREEGKFALFFLDLDNFKQINDSFGHHIGDKVLIEVAQRLQKTIRSEDTLARLGGDEFTIIMQSLEEVKNVVLFANKIQKALALPISLEGNDILITCSIGIGIYPHDTEKAEMLIKYADHAMYVAKESGGNTFRIYKNISKK